MKKTFGSIARIMTAVLIFAAALTVFGQTAKASAASKPTVSAAKKTMYLGGSKYTIKLKNTAKEYTAVFTSSDEKVAKVDKTKGKVTAVAEGKAVITVKIVQGGTEYTAKVTVTVKKPYIKFSAEAETEMAAGDTQDLAGLIDGYGVTIDEDNITYSTSKKSYAKVSEDGVVTAMRAGIGKTVTITATDSESELSCKLKITIVEAAPEVKAAEDKDTKSSDTGKAEEKDDKSASGKDTEVKEEKPAETGSKTVKADRSFLDVMFQFAVQQTSSNYSGDILTGKDEVARYIVDKVLEASGSAFSIAIKKDELLLTSEEYCAMFPALKGVDYTDCVRYANCYVVTVSGAVRDSFKTDEFNIYNAFKLGSTEGLTAKEKELYDTLISIAKECKRDKEADTAKKIHDWLIEKTKFTYNPFDGSSSESVYACVMPKQCSDIGYAKTYVMLCEFCGLECIKVDGTATNGGAPWSWNKVKIDGEWTNVDVAKDEEEAGANGAVSSGYFGLNDSAIASVYTPEEGDYPEATSQEFDYAYNLYQDLPRASTVEELMAIFKNASKSTAYIEFVDPTGSTSLYDDNQMLINFYASMVGVTPTVGATSAGVYGTYYKVNLKWKK